MKLNPISRIIINSKKFSLQLRKRNISFTGPSQVHVQLWRARSPHRGREDPARGSRRGRGPRFLQRQRARRKRENRRVHGR